MNFLGRSGSPYLTHYPTHIAHRREGQKNRENSSCQSTISIAFSLCLNWYTQLHLWLKHDFASMASMASMATSQEVAPPRPPTIVAQRLNPAHARSRPAAWWPATSLVTVTSSRIHTEKLGIRKSDDLLEATRMGISYNIIGLEYDVFSSNVRTRISQN